MTELTAKRVNEIFVDQLLAPGDATEQAMAPFPPGLVAHTPGR